MLVLASSEAATLWLGSKRTPGAFIRFIAKTGRLIRAKGYRVLFGEGTVDWKGIFAAAESVGAVEYYLVEQEGSRFSEFETAKKCLEAFHQQHG